MDSAIKLGSLESYVTIRFGQDYRGLEALSQKFYLKYTFLCNFRSPLLYNKQVCDRPVTGRR